MHDPELIFFQFFKKLSIELSYDPVILFIGVYPKELKIGALK
jgi:hypothetical protein